MSEQARTRYAAKPVLWWHVSGQAWATVVQRLLSKIFSSNVGSNTRYAVELGNCKLFNYKDYPVFMFICVGYYKAGPY
jgi:hypothetical protein